MDALFGGAGGGAGATANGHPAHGASGLTTSSSGAVYSSSSSEQLAGLQAAASILVNPAHFNGHDNGPILYTDPNRTSAIDDIRSIVIYIFIITIFLCFFLILPGIRNEKLPTFFCITTSLLVGSTIVLSLFGTSWHVAEAPISAAYKAFSRDRIQGDLKVRIGLQSVNISLKAHKYFILHHADGPVIMENMPPTTLLASMTSSSASGSSQSSSSSSMDVSASERREEHSTSEQSASSAAKSFIEAEESSRPPANEANFADELLSGRTSDGIPVDTELDSDEVFASSGPEQGNDQKSPTGRRSLPSRHKRQQESAMFKNQTRQTNSGDIAPKYTIKRAHVDINYNERFYWIGPVQMRHEYEQALERGLPFPILTVVEYLSQDDAGFNWSRRYRAAGYYTSMCLWLSVSVCVLMFCLHCAAPKYGIYTMQLLGCLLLLTNLTYATLVPKGDHQLVIPFEGESLTFRFGWNFWLVLIGGCLSLLVGTIFVILDNLFPNFIFTTVLDADFDSSQSYYQRKHKMILHSERYAESSATNSFERHQDKKPKPPSFIKRKILERESRSSSELNYSENSKHKLKRMQANDDGDEKVTNGAEQDQENKIKLEKSHKKSRSENISKHDISGQRSQNQVTSLMMSPNSKAIDHRDIDSRESPDDLRQTIRL